MVRTRNRTLKNLSVSIRKQYVTVREKVRVYIRVIFASGRGGATPTSNHAENYEAALAIRCLQIYMLLIYLLTYLPAYRTVAAS